MPAPARARSTQDLDVFLRHEILANASRARVLERALARLGYHPVETARYYHFAREWLEEGVERRVRIDLLTGPGSLYAGAPGVRLDARRVRPPEQAPLHGHPTEEAIGLEEGLQSYPLSDRRGTGETYEGRVYLPQAFTYALMKLFAFRDRLADEREDYGGRHALDLYMAFATTCESEWDLCRELSRRYRGEAAVQEAAQIARDYFGSPQSLGVLRLCESPHFGPELPARELCGLLRELLTGE